MKLKKANINYKKNKNIYLSIVFIVFVILCILIIMNTRVIKFDILIIIYKLYSLFGNIAWNNRYPIDYPYDRQDIIPKEVEILAKDRLITRAEKNWAKSDELRDQIKELGYEIKDIDGGYEINKM